MVEQWAGIPPLVHYLFSLPVLNRSSYTGQWHMDRKNINRGFKKLRVWQDAIALYVLASNLNWFNLSRRSNKTENGKIAFCADKHALSNIPTFQRAMIPMSCANSETSNYRSENRMPEVTVLMPVYNGMPFYLRLWTRSSIRRFETSHS